ncbi:hypothetical protein [Williamsia sp. CHRR-6]|uniref:hypothetical protein n=1 Tax=Williamsia sp. CHRR-6 TaxID=2835871 RepID=UPI001BDABA12|nr:hypothetical protein [Williamsia sp. CHRR-6]MBT0566742.1 hypothetical protein [Williamsia sp. CHRR-6]
MAVRGGRMGEQMRIDRGAVAAVADAVDASATRLDAARAALRSPRFGPDAVPADLNDQGRRYLAEMAEVVAALDAMISSMRGVAAGVRAAAAEIEHTDDAVGGEIRVAGTQR